MRKKQNNQQGAFSPFMFGMLMGVAVFSAAMNHWAKKEIVNINERNTAEDRAKAEQLKKALENSMLTENVEDGSYSDTFNLERAQKFLSGSTGTTRTGEQAFFSSTYKDGKFNTSNKRVLITASDDESVKAEIGALAGADAMGSYDTAEGSVVMFDSEEIRQEQIKKSKERLEAEASQIYRSYAAFGYKFPTTEQYKTNVNAVTGNRDVWGQEFLYERKSDKLVVISFTTPWGYTFKKTLNMN